MIVLDTNVWSVLPKPDDSRQVVDWIARHQRRLWLSTIVIAELRLGIENRRAAAKRARLELWLADLELVHSERILTFDAPDAHVFGKLIARGKLERQETKLLDLQLAAQAIARDVPVATRNLRDFAWTGVKLIDPWNG